MLQRTISGLTQDQPVRRHMDPEGAKQIDEYVEKIENLLTVKEAFHIVSKKLEIIIKKKNIEDFMQIYPRILNHYELN